MVSKSQIKLVSSLQHKKYRNQNGLFIVEGVKGVQEVLASSIEPYGLFKTDALNFEAGDTDVTVVSEAELRQMSALKNPNGVLGVFHIPDPKAVDFKDWVVVLDDIRDPGNLGTIIRLCDWFGISHLICSIKTVDCYNPKVLQATMGSITRVNLVYGNLKDLLNDCGVPVYGAFTDGDVVYSSRLPEAGILIMGNEANGISAEMNVLITKKIAIPQVGNKSTESLNVATATAILLSEVRRV